MSDMPDTYQSAELDGEFDEDVEAARGAMAIQDRIRLREAVKGTWIDGQRMRLSDRYADAIAAAVLEELMKPSDLQRDLSIEAIMQDEPPSSLMGGYLHRLRKAA